MGHGFIVLGAKRLGTFNYPSPQFQNPGYAMVGASPALADSFVCLSNSLFNGYNLYNT